MARIHPSATVSPECELAADVEIGPCCVLTGRVKLGPGVRLVGSVFVNGPVCIGEGTQVFPFACIGFPGQDVKFKLGDPTAGVVIGARGIIREHATVHAATNEHTPTTIGDQVFLMVNSHVGHDARVGNSFTMVNNAAIGGHTRVGDSVTFGGGAMLHQHCRVGRLAFLSGGAQVSTNIPPFCTVALRNSLAGINVVGMRRADFPRDQITAVRRAYRDVFRSLLPRSEMVTVLEQRGRTCPPIAEMARFVAESNRSICPDSRRARRARTEELAADTED